MFTASPTHAGRAFPSNNFSLLRVELDIEGVQACCYCHHSKEELSKTTTTTSKKIRSIMFRFVSLIWLALSTAAAAHTGESIFRLGGRRRLEEAEQADFSWMSGYTVKFEQCFVDNGSNLVYFSLCPVESGCNSGCEGGTEYVAELLFFIDAFTEAQLGAREYACEMARENCNDDDEANCYQNYGLDYCDDNEDEFDLQEYLECEQFDDEYFVAPYCSDDGYNIYLGYFADDACTNHADEGTFYNTYGYELQYSAASGVAINEDPCANCREHGMEQDQAEGDQQDEDDVLEQCEELYEASVDWESVSEQYDGEVRDIRVGNSKKRTGWIIAIAVLVGILACGICAYAMNPKKSGGSKSTPLVSAN